MSKQSAFGTIAALALSAFVATAAVAADSTPAVASTIDWAAAQKARATMQAQLSRTTVLAKKLGVTGAKPAGAKPGEAFANVDRAYPPSCLSSPLALGLWHHDPASATNIAQTQIILPGDPYSNNSAERAYSESVTVTLFRVPCSAGTSATLLEIDRPSANEGNSALYPTFPGVSVGIGGGNAFYIRLADDPNTFFSTTYGLSPMVNSDVYMLENFYGGATQFNYNQAFTLYIDNFLTNDPNRVTQYNLPVYDPTKYAEASQPLPISGYMSTAWYDPAHSGEGMFIQVYDNGDSATRTLTATWYTYDNLGIPFWLYAQGTVNIGDTQLTAGVNFLSGGGFAGSANATSQPWGTMSFSFPDCADLTFSYHSTTTALPNGPTGSGTRLWQRLADVNGLVCQ